MSGRTEGALPRNVGNKILFCLNTIHAGSESVREAFHCAIATAAQRQALGSPSRPGRSHCCAGLPFVRKHNPYRPARRGRCCVHADQAHAAMQQSSDTRIREYRYPLGRLSVRQGARNRRIDCADLATG